MKKVLVTGGSGLVGKAIESLSPDFVFLSSKDCDLTDYSQTLELFKKIQPDVIIHLAACIGGLYKNMNNGIKMLEDNLLINTHVLKAAHLCGVQEIVACLSSCIFPDGECYLNETMIHNGPPHTSNEGYAYAKRMLEVQCRMYQKKFGRRYFCIIPTNIYGPHDNFNLEDAHVIPTLIHKCFLAKQNGIPFEVRGTGKPLRQFIYSIDIAKLILLLLESDTCENVILSSSSEVSILEVAEIINEHFGNVLITNPSYSDGQYRKTVDNTKLQTIVGPDFEFTDLKQGIKTTVQWFIENYDSLRK